jgi:hypothetical protein
MTNQVFWSDIILNRLRPLPLVRLSDAMWTLRVVLMVPLLVAGANLTLAICVHSVGFVPTDFM